MTDSITFLPNSSVPFVILDTTEKHGSSVIIYLDNDPPIFTASTSNVTVVLGVGAEILAPSTLCTLSVSAVEVVVTNNPIVITTPVIPSFLFSNVGTTAIFTVEELVGLDDAVIVPILEEMSNVNNDITKTSINSKTVWTATVLENHTPQLDRSIVNILTSNYQKFTDIRNKKASKFAINRRSY